MESRVLIVIIVVVLSRETERATQLSRGEREGTAKETGEKRPPKSSHRAHRDGAKERRTDKSILGFQ